MKIYSNFTRLLFVLKFKKFPLLKVSASGEKKKPKFLRPTMNTVKCFGGSQVPRSGHRLSRYNFIGPVDQTIFFKKKNKFPSKKKIISRLPACLDIRLPVVLI